MSVAIAVFVKTPCLSPLKTRLAAGVGDDKALAFYHLSLQAVEETLKNYNATPYWAVAEEEGVGNPLWHSFDRLYVGGGGLGQRQHYVYETLLKQHDYVFLIGADSPQIDAMIFDQARQSLIHNDFVVGPAYDGGYYLFGGRVSFDKDVWERVEYSQKTTCAELVDALPSAPDFLTSLSDVDKEENLKDVVTEMSAKPNKAQQKLINWIDTL